MNTDTPSTSPPADTDPDTNPPSTDTGLPWPWIAAHEWIDLCPDPEKWDEPDQEVEGWLLRTTTMDDGCQVDHVVVHRTKGGQPDQYTILVRLDGGEELRIGAQGKHEAAALRSGLLSLAILLGDIIIDLNEGIEGLDSGRIFEADSVAIRSTGRFVTDGEPPARMCDPDDNEE